MANTTNFNWETPDDTDLVKDGAAAIRTLGSAIDTSLVDLKGGTTDQVLAKNSNSDMDFKWVADASGIPATIFDAKGDIIAASAADTAARLAVGANNTVLTADSSTATGLKWAAAASPTFVGCGLKKDSGQTISNNTITAVTFASENFDSDGFHDNVTNNSRITIPTGKGGKYQVNFNGQWAGNTTGFRYGRIYKNGVDILSNWFKSPTTNGDCSQMLSVILNLSAGDYIQFYVEQNSGGDLILRGDDHSPGSCSFNVAYLGA